MILSVSQVESFDPRQKGGCERRFWFERVAGLKPDQDTAQGEGEALHAHLARWLSVSEMPKKRTLMSKAATGAIVKGLLPAPGPDLLVERRFDGQAQRDVNGDWIPCDVEKTLHLGGLPWDGMIDLAYRRSEIPVIVDHKGSSNPREFAKRADELIKTIQLPVYVLAMLRLWPDAKRWKIAHHNVNRNGVESFVRSAVVGIDQVLERKADIEKTVARIVAVSAATSQEDVPFNRRSCSAWTGCPHQSVCSAYRENKMSMNLSPEDQALFNDLDGMTEPPAAPVRPSGRPAITDASLPSPADVAATPPAPSAQAVDTAAAKRERLRAELAAMEAEEKAEAAKVAEAARIAALPKCALGCGTALDPTNSSKLTSGLIKHIGCPKEVSPALAAAAKAGAPGTAGILPPDAPASNPANASEQPAPPAEPKKTRGKAAAASVELSAGGPVILELGPKTLEALAALLKR